MEGLKTKPHHAEVDRLIVECGEARLKLEASRRDACAEHNERIRKLRDLETSLRYTRANAGDEMFEVSSVVSPELDRLIKDPTHAL